jgi:hypothetical protein
MIIPQPSYGQGAKVEIREHGGREGRNVIRMREGSERKYSLTDRQKMFGQLNLWLMDQTRIFGWTVLMEVIYVLVRQSFAQRVKTVTQFYDIFSQEFLPRKCKIVDIFSVSWKVHLIPRS